MISYTLSERAHSRHASTIITICRCSTRCRVTDPCVLKVPGHHSYVSVARDPLCWAAVEAGKWGRVRPGRRCICDAFELVFQYGAGATDRNCRLLP
jgi:hypothetical protein